MEADGLGTWAMQSALGKRTVDRKIGEMLKISYE
jgi:hypothetical protein